MKILNIKSLKSSLMALLAMIVVSACVDETKAPIVTFDSAGHGAYPKFISDEGATLINILTEADFNASSYTYSIEFIDEAEGSSVSNYDVTVSYNGGDPITIQSYPSSSFTTSEAGNAAVTNIQLTGPDVASAFGLGYADLTAGDEFRVEGVLTTPVGVFTSTNSSATVRGNAFQGFFTVQMPAACPSDLAGTYDYVTTDIWCDGSSTSGTVDIVALGGGKYEFADWAFGSYGTCYGGGGAEGDLSFTETCRVVAFTGFTDSFGDTWTYVSSISGEEWTIAWDNTYGESATSVITFPGGVPFTLE